MKTFSKKGLFSLKLLFFNIKNNKRLNLENFLYGYHFEFFY